MDNTPLLQFVKPLDVLLFRPDSLAGWMIAVKTWSRDASHCEVVAYTSERLIETFSARGSVTTQAGEKGGVNFFRDLPSRISRISHVLRLRDQSGTRPLSAYNWALTRAVGQGYDYAGLLVFSLAARQGALNKMFCSEACTRYLRAAEADPFHPNADADLVAPGTFLFSPAFIQYPVENGLVLISKGR